MRIGNLHCECRRIPATVHAYNNRKEKEMMLLHQILGIVFYALGSVYYTVALVLLVAEHLRQRDKH